MLITLGLFQAVHDREHRIILAAVGLVYTSVRGGQLVSAYAVFSLSPALGLLQRIAVATIQGYEIDKEEWTEAEKLKVRSMVKMTITSIGLTAISVICVLQILTP